MNGKTVSTLKPPLHKGCVCTVGRGERFRFTASTGDDIIQGEWSGANFANYRAFEKHKKHIAEYGDISTEEYVKGARNLLNAPASEDVEAFWNSSDALYKYQHSTNDFVIGRNGQIITRFRPDDGAAYWKGEKEREQT